MAVQTIKATIQMRRGAEQSFDPDQMTAGEWAVSTDSKKVWMCFAPGIVRRMATYEGFEQDMREIQTILAACQEIQTAVEAFERLAELHKNDADRYSKLSRSWAEGETGVRPGESTNNSKYHSQKSEEAATLSKSWAVGGTNTRTGEDTDNSKYYSQKSKDSSDTSKEYLIKVEQAGKEAVDKIKDALDMDAPDFHYDFETGILYYSGGRFVFGMNNGILEWGLAV